MTYQTIQTELTQGVALIWLNRPQLRNALNETMIAELTDAVSAAHEDPAVRAIVLAGRGAAFCAGADLNWLKRAREMTPEESVADSAPLAQLLRLLHEGPKPSIARVHGPAYAGGMGLVAACDIAVASQQATFCLSEVKLGLVAAMISPYVIKAMGERHARRWFLTAEVFEAAQAYRMGFVQELVSEDKLDATVNAMLGQLMLGSPAAIAQSKSLIGDVADRPIDDALVAETAQRIARCRATDDAQEGMAAFFEKRRPRWVPSQS
jgi:methylglutaconyl-CoA hydratase